MRYEFIGPFVGTSVRVLETVVPGTHRTGDAVMVSGDQVKGEVRIVIAITGDTQGDVTICMDRTTATAVCTALLGAPVKDLTPEACDALAELGNMIAGNAVSSLNDLGFDLAVARPDVRVEADVPAGDRAREAMQVSLACPCGPLTVNLNLGTN